MDHQPLHPASRLGALEREETHLLDGRVCGSVWEPWWDWRDPEAEGAKATSDRQEHQGLTAASASHGAVHKCGVPAAHTRDQRGIHLSEEWNLKSP